MLNLAPLVFPLASPIFDLNSQLASLNPSGFSIKLNPYLQARYYQEVLRDPEAAMHHLNAELGKVIGEVPFHSFDARRLQQSKQEGFSNRFETLIGYHLYHREPYGTSDYLNVPYHKAFTALWEMFPQWEWILELSMKDFRVPSIDQLYIDAVPPSEYGERNGPARIQATLQKSIDSGQLWLGHGHWRPFGIIHYQADLILESQSAGLLGLREWLLEKAASFQPPCSKETETTFWEQQGLSRPDWILERGMDMLSYVPDYPHPTRSNWTSATNECGFWKVFARALEKVLDQDLEMKTAVAEYARIPLGLHGKAAEFLADLLLLVEGDIDMDGFCGRWLNVE